MKRHAGKLSAGNLREENLCSSGCTEHNEVQQVKSGQFGYAVHDALIERKRSFFCSDQQLPNHSTMLPNCGLLHSAPACC